MVPFHQTLKNQHEEIWQSWQALFESWHKREAESCQKAAAKLHQQLENHFLSEDEILFSKVAGNPLLNGGGPFCAYFYDLFMMDRPLEKALKRINQNRSTENRLRTIEIPESAKPYFAANSMICVPVEEHIALLALLSELEAVFKTWPVRNENWLDFTLEDFQKILRANLEKEENCLWLIAQQFFAK